MSKHGNSPVDKSLAPEHRAHFYSLDCQQPLPYRIMEARYPLSTDSKRGHLADGEATSARPFQRASLELQR
jgi:hypothetical protein